MPNCDALKRFSCATVSSQPGIPDLLVILAEKLEEVPYDVAVATVRALERNSGTNVTRTTRITKFQHGLYCT